jgi:hypothetical protein
METDRQRGMTSMLARVRAGDFSKVKLLLQEYSADWNESEHEQIIGTIIDCVRKGDLPWGKYLLEEYSAKLREDEGKQIIDIFVVKRGAFLGEASVK